MARLSRITVVAGVFAFVTALNLGISSAKAHDGIPQGVGYGHPVPSYGYYGNGGHDFAPHWHARQTPFGPQYWYGVGRHDARPHGHTVTPYGIESYNSPWMRSYAPPYPHVYRRW